ncbi:MAG: DNA alkylation repair protein, partial [Planctomycetota bacterium]
KKLESLGSAQTRKTYGRHGVTGKMFGVKYGDLGKLVKQVKVDHDLALKLWPSGNFDARVLATMIADPEKLTAKVLTAWLKDVDNHGLSYALSVIAARSPAGRKLMPKWMESTAEWPAATGWMMLSDVIREHGPLSATEGRKLLKTIEKRVHGAKNRVKYSMNTVMIALGTYVSGLEKEAIQTANRIGQIEVDHGLTNCQTPLAAPYIKKAAAHHRAKLAKAAKKKASKRVAKRKVAS